MTTRHARRTVWFWLTLAALAVLTLFLLYPLSRVLIGSFGGAAGGPSGWARVASEPKYLSAVFNSITLGLVVTLGAAEVLLVAPLTVVWLPG